LEKSLIREIEDLIKVDENYYKIYALGETAIPKSAIYTHQQLTNQLPDKYDNECMGLDFGFNHPTAAIMVGMLDNKIYAKELLYKSHLTSSDLINEFKLLQISKITPIICDYARPEIITDLRRAGYNVFNADKNVKEGIDAVKSSQLYIYNESHNLWKEINNYKWKTSGDRIIDEPVKLYDDGCDALRYAVLHMKKRFSNTPPSFAIFSI
jgi:phage terminase large subunit